MEHDQDPRPGEAWLGIVTRAAPDDFARAFTAEPVLEASVLAAPIVGAAALHAFFRATRGMYDRIAFTRQGRSGSQTYLEWEGEYRARRVAGVTILSTTADGAIERVRLFPLPFDQVVEFSSDLRRRLGPAGPPGPTGNTSSTERARALVRSFYDSGARGEITSFRHSLADDFELSVPPSLPWGGRFGKQEYVDLLPQVVTALDFRRLKYLSLTAEGLHVVALIEIGVQGTERTIIISEHWDIANDKVARLFVAYFDPKILLDQLSGSSAA